MAGDIRKLNWDYPWLKELKELRMIELVRKIENSEVELDAQEYRKVKNIASLEAILKYAECARGQPEVWDMIVGINNRYRKDPDTLITDEENEFLSSFCHWYLLKNDLAYAEWKIRTADSILLKIANAELPDDMKSPEIYEFLKSNL